MMKIISGHFHFILVKDLTVGHITMECSGPDQVVNTVDILQIHGNAFQAIGDLTGHRLAIQPADLLKIGKLTDLHPVQPDFPAQPPGA